MDFTRLIESESATLAALHAEVHRSAAQRQRDPASRRRWENACRDFHAYVSPLDRYLQPACVQALYTDPESIEFAVRFLELDPRFFRSGYLKQILITRLKRSKLGARDTARLRQVVIDAAERRAGREYRYYCRLAAVIADAQVVARLEAMRQGEDRARAHRARMMCECINGALAGR